MKLVAFIIEQFKKISVEWRVIIFILLLPSSIILLLIDLEMLGLMYLVIFYLASLLNLLYYRQMLQRGLKLQLILSVCTFLCSISILLWIVTWQYVLFSSISLILIKMRTRMFPNLFIYK
jgi:hypothetical protein